jgi:serine O-acetyltransferase
MKDNDQQLYQQLQQEALTVQEQEPALSALLHKTVLNPGVSSFEDAVASTVCYRLLLQCSTNINQNAVMDRNSNIVQDYRVPSSNMFCPNYLFELIRKCMSSSTLERNHTMAHAIRQDVLAVINRDPAMDSILQVVLFSKGYAALVCHRAAYRLYHTQKYTALFLQSQASAVFGLDIHPLAQLGIGLMLDHGTGVVIGETAVVGDNCTLLHGVTLGGTGKDAGDRHPKIGDNVLIGAGTSVLGNIHIGNGAKIGAGSVVLRAIPPGATAVGAPAKILGHATESRPGSEIDETLEHVSLLHKSQSLVSTSTVSTNVMPSEEESSMEPHVESSFTSTSSEDDEDSNMLNDGQVCPFRNYQRMSKTAPIGTITICSLEKILKPLGCTLNEIGSVFFALDSRDVGYVHLDEECRKNYMDAIVNNTRLTKEMVHEKIDISLAVKIG